MLIPNSVIWLLTTDSILFKNAKTKDLLMTYKDLKKNVLPLSWISYEK